MKTKESHEFLPHPRPYYPWLILSISLVFQYYKQLLLISPSVMVGQLAQRFQFDTNKLGLLIAMALYSFFIFQIPVGILMDKCGIRRITSLGILISAIGILLFGYAPTETYAFVGRFLIGLGSSVALLNIVKLLTNWFQPKMFAFLIGVTIAIGALGDLTGIYLTEAIIKAFGAKVAMLNYGLIGIIFAIVFFLVVRDNVPGAQYDINPKVQRLKLSSTIIRMFKRKQSWILALYAGFAQTLFPVFLCLWGIPYLMSRYQYTEPQAIGVHAAFLGGLTITAPLIGYISTAVKKRKIFVVISTLFATTLSIAIVRFNSPSFSLYLSMFFLQGASFGIFPLVISIMREQNVSKISATSFAFLNSTYAILAAISEQAMGFLFDFKWQNTLFKGIVSVSSDSFYSILLRSTFWLGVAFIFSLFIKDTYAKQRIKEDLSGESRK